MRVIIAVVMLLSLGVVLGALAHRTANAYNSWSCGGQWWRWSGQSTTFDYDEGISEGWWQAEIIYANGVWDNSSVGADFDFTADSSSNNDWRKVYDPYESKFAFTYPTPQCSGQPLNVTEADTWFNTRYTWEDCDSGTCSSGAYDVQTVAIHEFGHWLVLNEIPLWKIWDNNCAMYEMDHGVDRTLCDHDIAGIQEMYGTD